MHIGVPAVRGKKIQGQGKVREFCEQLEKICGYGKVREKFGDLVMNAHNKSIILLSQSGHVSGRAGGQRAAARLVEPISL